MSDGRRAALLLLITAIGFGGTWVAAPWATDEVAPLVVAWVRFSLAAVLLLSWCAARGRSIRIERSDVPAILAVAATSVVGYNVLFLYGVTLAPASHGAILVPGLIPMATLVLARLVLGSPIVTRQVVGVVMSIAGLALVVGPELTGTGSTLVGDAMFVTSAGLWAAYTLVGRASRLESSVLTFYGAAVGAALLLPLAILVPDGHRSILSASPRALASVLYLGSIGTTLSFVTFLGGVRLIGAARAAAYTVLVPVFGLTFTVTLLGEPFTPVSLVGAVVVLVGLRVTQTAGSPATAPAMPPENVEVRTAN